VVNYGGSNPVTVGVSWNLDSTAVEQKFTVLLTIGDKVFNFVKMGLRVKGADVVVFVTWSNSEGLCSFNKLWYPFLGVTDEDNN
jgi:hypothetical protein